MWLKIDILSMKQRFYPVYRELPYYIYILTPPVITLSGLTLAEFVGKA